MNEFRRMPVIRVELDRAKYSIAAMISDEMMSMDEDIRVAVESACTPENVKRIVARAVDDTLNQVINDTIQDYFRYGKGREALKKAVEQQLEDQQEK